MSEALLFSDNICNVGVPMTKRGKNINEYREYKRHITYIVALKKAGKKLPAFIYDHCARLTSQSCSEFQGTHGCSLSRAKEFSKPSL